MSQFPPTGAPGSPPNPFAAAPGAYPPPRRSNTWLWILLGLGGIGVLGCCGCGGLMWFSVSAAGGILDKQMVSKLKDDAAAKEHLGEVISAKWDMMASGEATQKAGGGKNILVFHVKGSKANGDVHAEQAPGAEVFQNARLIMSDGQEIPLGF
jgi:hypothetical protein